MSRQRLDLLAASDPRLLNTPEVVLLGSRSDPGHAQRRCQQRGITRTKIRIALAYGRQCSHSAGGAAVVQLKTCKWNYRLRRH